MFYITGKIIKGIGGLYFVDCSNIIYECSVRGIFRKNKIIPTIGDIVDIEVLDENEKKGCIHKIYDRTNMLLRPKVVNIDCAVIISSIKKPNINTTLLDKFLILTETQDIKQVIICINKCDLANSSELEEISRVYENIYNVIFTSTTENIGIDKLKQCLLNKVTVFAGPSGVGKSSLINSIIPSVNLRTGEISQKISRGKHTTRQVELLKICDDTYIIDSPGFTSLDLSFIKSENLDLYFKEFLPFINQCKFKDCNHIFEPDCAVKQQVGNFITEERYKRYKLFFNELSERN